MQLSCHDGRLKLTAISKSGIDRVFPPDNSLNNVENQ
jgi:hypothetical protein